ncbi:hypothetical protein BS50DRAFT_677179 [Corynespora cassiicola Philippines]|uniref:Uncharacterized protein n=1 Tax=Corynespora cassiicola Philippines TaxID=1448308 RepID=A0A2T2NKP3_CORCC|nr:hypothetical protein BS50DRAFT_677179 [Corynespora cassiicola Philippines]
MATPNIPPPLTPDQRLALEQKQRYDSIKRNLAIGGVIICPLLIVMPPRKLDLYTLTLGLGFYLAADQLSESYTGKGLVQNISFGGGSGSSAGFFRELPTERAREVQKAIREKEELERRGREALREGGVGKEGEEGQGKEEFWKKVWMGGEKEGWRERRLEEEKKAIEEGKSYTDLIFEQIWDVWNWGGKKGDGEGNGKKE